MSEAGQEAVVDTPPAEEPRPGRVLAQAREQRGQTIAEVAQQLKLSPHQIESLEADDFSKLPGPVFVRGFVRNYARLLNLDPEPLLSRLEPSHATLSAINAVPHSQEIPFESGRKSRWPWLAAVLALLVTAVLLFDVLFHAWPPAPGLPVTPLPVTPLPSTPSAVTETPPIEPVAPAAPPAPPGDTPAVQGNAPTAPAPQPAATVAGGAELRLVFERQSWVEVRDRNDRVLFSQLNPAGAVQTVQGTPPLSLVVGNAAGVRLTYKGKVVDLAPHTKTDVARLTLE
ncbi:MAG: helix-turn-helix domain-containing protein [Betaproteobacteria bacterium]|jgi:cytoskeleton protein RodZ